MASLWVIIGLIIATISVSILGAAFSVIGLGALFSGAVLAVSAMAASLEFAKFVLAAYLHQRRSHLNFLLKVYLIFAVVVLSGITSMGIFGYLSNAYQSASSVLEGENIKLEALKAQQSHNTAEIARLNKAIDEIPANRVTKRMNVRAEAEPAIAALTKQSEEIDAQIAQSNLRILDVKQKVGPLIYIAKAFQMDIDVVVKYLILVFVSVFDPLAICLVIATSEALESRRKPKLAASSGPQQTQSQPIEPVNAPVIDPTTNPTTAPAAGAKDEVILMRFASNDKADKKRSKRGVGMAKMNFLERKPVIQLSGIALILSPFFNTLITMATHSDLPNRWSWTTFTKLLTSGPTSNYVLYFFGFIIGGVMLRGSATSWKYVLVLLGANIAQQASHFDKVKSNHLNIFFFVVNVTLFLLVTYFFVWKQPVSIQAPRQPERKPEPIPEPQPAPPIAQHSPPIHQPSPLPPPPQTAYEAKKKIVFQFEGLAPWAELMNVSSKGFHLRSISPPPAEVTTRDVEFAMKNGLVLRARLTRQLDSDYFFEYQNLQSQDIQLLKDWLKACA